MSRELANLTNEDIEAHTKDQLKAWIRRLDPYFKVSGSLVLLRTLLRRERDRALELQHLRIRRQEHAAPPATQSAQQPAVPQTNHEETNGGDGNANANGGDGNSNTNGVANANFNFGSFTVTCPPQDVVPSITTARSPSGRPIQRQRVGSTRSHSTDVGDSDDVHMED